MAGGNKRAKQVNNVPTVSQKNKYAANGIGYNIASETEQRFSTYLSAIAPGISPIANQIYGDSLTKKKKKTDPNKADNVSDIIKGIANTNSFDSLVASNERIKVTLKDYDLIKRTLPPVYKILHDLQTALMNPEVLSDNNFLLEKPAKIADPIETAIEKLTSVEGYDINTKIESIVEDYLIISRAYYLVTPYNALPNMLKTITGSVDASFMLSETAKPLLGEEQMTQTLLETFSPDVDTLEAAKYDDLEDTLNMLTESVTCKVNMDSVIQRETVTNLHESAFGITPESEKKKDDPDPSVEDLMKDFDKLMESFGEIEVVRGPIDIYKNDLLSEAAAKSDFITNSSMNRMVKMSSLPDETRKLHAGANITEKDEKAIEKLELNGCFVEKLNPSRVVPLISKSGKRLGYFFIRDDIKAGESGSLTASDAGLFSSLNSKLVNKMTNKGNIPQIMSMEIAKRILTSMDSRFLANNIENMDDIFEFVKDFIMVQNRSKKKIHFIHPDDMVEFVRPDGSIMKNCIVLARLAILLMVSNIMAKVTSGYDRNIYYIDLGLSTDVAKGVEDAINAIIDGRITMDSISSMDHVFGVAGSATDVFIPRDSQGNKPIDTEVMSGQDIDMDEEFIQFLINNILLSFGVEPSALDFTSDVEFAKSLSMVDIRIARNSLKEQKIINPSLDKLVKKILMYELGDEYAGDIMQMKAKLQPPKIIILEMMEEIFGTVTDFSEKLSEILVEPDKDETREDKIRRLFNKALIAKYIPTLDIDEFMEILDEIADDAKEELANAKIATKKEDGEYDNDDDMEG